MEENRKLYVSSPNLFVEEAASGAHTLTSPDNRWLSPKEFYSSITVSGSLTFNRRTVVTAQAPGKKTRPVLQFHLWLTPPIGSKSSKVKHPTSTTTKTVIVLEISQDIIDEILHHLAAERILWDPSKHALSYPNPGFNLAGDTSSAP